MHVIVCHLCRLTRVFDYNLSHLDIVEHSPHVGRFLRLGTGCLETSVIVWVDPA